MMASWSEARRTVLEAKIREYESMPQHERDVRLQATELRFFLRPLLEVAPEARGHRLDHIPENLRPLVQERLATWDALPEAVRKEFLLFDREAAQVLRGAPARAPENNRVLVVETQLDQWRSLPTSERDETVRQFELFFELSPRQRERVLGELEPAEREQMQQALDTFSRMTPAQRRVCLSSFRKLAELNPRERSAFLTTVDRWRELPPAERERWRFLVANLPPLPPGLGVPELPPMPPAASDRPRFATNSSR